MPRIVVDETLHQKLPTWHQIVELVDANGNLLGSFVPGMPAESNDPEPTEDELRRLEQIPGPNYTTAQVLAHLERLAQENPS
jgi:hypothetical protein